jgi:lipoprotein NlpD
LTAYGYNKTLMVKEGDSVARGQTIASMGRAPDRSVRLHFEIRDSGKPVDPAAYLPPRRR